MYKVLVVSHSNLCKGFKDALEMILGQSSSVEYLGLDEDGIDFFYQSLKNKIDELKKGSDEILVLADLFGGSPFNRVLIEASKDEKIKLISGVNLPMVIEAVMNETSKLDEVILQIIESGKDSIKKGIILNNNDSEDE